MPRRLALPVAAVLLSILGLIPASRHAAAQTFTALPWSAVGDSALNTLGRSVAPAGDVNGDGYGDVLVSAPQDGEFFVNEGRVFLYLGSANGLETTPAWAWSPGAAEVYGGNSVASAGDVNGDGYDDILIGIDEWDTVSFTEEGRVAVFHGGPGGLPATPTYNLFNDLPGNSFYFGASVATAGDVNGDGYADVVIGSPTYSDVNVQARGRASIHHGGPGGLSLSRAIALEGNFPFGDFGASVSSAGDVNGDGYADVLVGAPSVSNGFSQNGAASLFLGSASGVLGVPVATIYGTANAERMGSSVANAGDINGDGYADILIGSPGFVDNILAFGGKAELHYGAPAGLGSKLVYLNDSAPGSNYGRVVATLGDLNGDGYADFGISSRNAAVDSKGMLTVNLGGKDGPIFLGGLLPPLGEADNFASSFATTGDVNGDGFSEIVIGDRHASIPPHNFAGRAWLYKLGRRNPFGAAGWPMNAGQSGSRAGASMAVLPRFDNVDYPVLVTGAPNLGAVGGLIYNRGTLGGATPTPFKTETSPASNALGTRVADIGDFNRDGYTDLLVSAPLQTGSFTEAGRVFIYLGTGGAPSAPIIALDGEQNFQRLGNAIAGRGDVNGDGLHDFLVASQAWSEPGIANCGKVQLVYGSGAVPAAPGWNVVGTAENQRLGASVALCDLDGDGFSDVVVSSVTPPDAPVLAPGKVEVYFGGPGGAATTPGLTLRGFSGSTSFGQWVAPVGDVNGDGICDLGVGAPLDGASGRAYIFAGSLGRSQSQLPIWNRLGTQGGARYGEAIAGGGDIDGDGFGDFVVGEPGWSNGQVAEGRMHVFFGAPYVPEPTAAYTFESNTALAETGFAFAPLNDINNDGFADVIVSTPGTTGRVWIFLGGGQGGGGPHRFRILEAFAGSTRRMHPTRLVSQDAIAASLLLRSPAGRSKLGYQFEIRTQDEPFVGQPTSSNPFTLDTGTPGSLNEVFPVVNVPWPDRAYHARARLTSGSPFFPHSRWITSEAHSSGDADFWTSGTVVAVTPPPSHAGTVARLVGAAPNPAGRGTASRIDLTLPAPGPVTLDVFDAGGRHVRRLAEGGFAAGISSRPWDGRDEQGRSVAAGVYFVVLQAGAASDRMKVVRLQ